MVVTTSSSHQQLSKASSTNERFANPKPCLWDPEFVIDNLPPWLYTDNKPPESLTECEAKISAIEYTIKDIELQIEIGELELRTGSSRHQTNFDYEKWKTQALRAKQTHYYLLNAHKYWLIKNKVQELDTDKKLRKLIELLVEDPADFIQRAALLLD